MGNVVLKIGCFVFMSCCVVSGLFVVLFVIVPKLFLASADCGLDSFNLVCKAWILVVCLFVTYLYGLNFEF